MKDRNDPRADMGYEVIYYGGKGKAAVYNKFILTTKAEAVLRFTEAFIQGGVAVEYPKDYARDMCTLVDELFAAMEEKGWLLHLPTPKELQESAKGSTADTKAALDSKILSLHKPN